MTNARRDEIRRAIEHEADEQEYGVGMPRIRAAMTCGELRALLEGDRLRYTEVCEEHPDHDWPHEGCTAAGIPRAEAVRRSLFLLGKERQRARELEALLAEATVFHREAVARAESAEAKLDDINEGWRSRD